MVNFSCFYCPYETDKRSNIVGHICRKNPCSETNNKDYAYLKEDYIYICKLCFSELDSINSVNQHLRKSCKVKKEKLKVMEYNKKKDEVEKLESELVSKKSELTAIENTISSHNTTNTNTNIHVNSHNTNMNITINNNPIILEFGKEDTSKLSHDDEKDIIKSCYKSIIVCAEKVHCNPNIPENQNALVTNMRSDYGFKYEDGKFKATNLEELVLDIIRSRADNVRDILERIDTFNLPSTTKKRTKEKVNILLENIDNNDEKTMYEIRKELILLLYNNKEMIMNNEKKIKNMNLCGNVSNDSNQLNYQQLLQLIPPNVLEGFIKKQKYSSYLLHITYIFARVVFDVYLTCTR